MNQYDFAAILVVASAAVLTVYLVYRYYESKVRYAYKTERLSYDELVVTDGGDPDDGE